MTTKSTAADMPSVSSDRNRATKPYVNQYGRKPRAYRYPAANRAGYKSTRKRMPQMQLQKQRLIPNLPDCAVHYLKALCNPWDTEAGVCVPADLFPLPSQKVKSYCRGTFATGTTGYGFISFGPSGSNDANPIRATSLTTVQASATLFSAATNTNTYNFSKLPYTDADITTNKLAQVRIVAAGIRIRYTGTEANRSGTCISFEDADHSSTLVYSWDTISQEYQSHMTRPRGDGEWDATVCLSGPVAPGELDFASVAFPLGTQASVPAFVIAVKSLALDTYEFEAVVHVEYIGSKVPGKTASHADGHAYSKVVQATKMIAADKSLEPADTRSVWSKFVGFMSESLPKIGAAIGSMAGPAGTLALGAAGSLIGGAIKKKMLPEPGEIRRMN